MAIETERKYLVRDDRWRTDAGAARELEQFYLFVAPDRTCRVRIVDRREATLTIKTGSGLSRGEFEYEIPLQDAEDLRPAHVGAIVTKQRFERTLGSLTVEIDVFSGELAGLVLAEIEVPDGEAEFETPPYLGREVTGDPAYTNARLAMDGRPPEGEPQGAAP